MSVKTDLSMEISKDNNPKVIRLFDTSSYGEGEKINNYLIEVLPVNKTSWVTFVISEGFSLVLNSSNLRYHRVSSSTDLVELPDGIYEFKQSYKPNVHTVVHFYYLRTVKVTSEYLKLLNKHFSAECRRDKRDFVEDTNKLTKIKQYIDAAEFAVSDMHDKEIGLKYYNYALDLIKKFDNECNCR